MGPTPLEIWLTGARPKTLPAAAIPVLVGSATVVAGGHSLIWWRAIAALLVSVALQVGANYANDYSDGIRGTDDETRVGPARLVGGGLASPASVRRAAMWSFAVAASVGLTLALAVGLELLAVGATSILAAWFYTGGSRPYGYAGLGEVFVFVFFGLVATVGSAYVHLETVSGLAVWAALPVGLLITAILVANNLRDIPGDRLAGKVTLAVRLGEDRTRLLYTALVIAAFLLLVPICAAATRWTPALGCLAIPQAFRLIGVVRSGARGPALIPVLSGTGQLVAAFGIALVVGLVL